MNWRSGGHLLCAHRLPATQTDVPVITSVALDSDWIVVGLANCKIYVFSAKTGVLARTLVGHELGVWAVNLVSQGGYWSNPDVSPGPRSQDPGQARSQSLGSPARRFRSTDEDMSELGASTSPLPMHDNAGVHGLEHSVPPSLRYTLGLARPRIHRRDQGHGWDAGIGKRSDPAGASEGWGQPNALIVSGGCDKVLRVWDVKSG
jgi:F-box and WD-40 domain protein CDC4